MENSGGARDDALGKRGRSSHHAVALPIMQNALEQVAIHCTNEVDAYQICVDSKPNSWQTDCALLSSGRRSTGAPPRTPGLVNAIKEQCKGEIEQYERCLKANAGSADTCMPALKRLWKRARKVAAAINTFAVMIVNKNTDLK